MIVINNCTSRIQSQPKLLSIWLPPLFRISHYNIFKEIQQYEKKNRKKRSDEIGGIELERLDLNEEVLKNAISVYKNSEACGIELEPLELVCLQAAEELLEYRKAEKQDKDRWIPITERLPENGQHVMVSVNDFSLPDMAHYKEDENGGAFYPGDDENSYSQYDLFVNAWMPLPEPYKEVENE